ncbi:MAG TPA: polysaccharide deacetylase family protein [Actinomycetota bacterium]|nr:polysaccharide deacetylase family protein [Actinomycetota bacterium]
MTGGNGHHASGRNGHSRGRPVRRLLFTTAALATVHAAPALAVTALGRPVFRTVRHLDQPGKVGLTFDDGPEPQAVEAFLAALAELEVTATFFLVGEQVRRSPQSARAIVEAGHEIACHGYRHLNHLRLTPPGTVKDLLDARDIIEGETGALVRHFRPPYGVFSAASWVTSGRLGWNRVLWARWGKDWEPTATPALIHSRLLEGVRDRDVLLLHDAEAYSSAGAWRRTLGALEPIVAELRSKGLEPGPVGAALGEATGRR